MKKLAVKELKELLASDEQVVLGDGWWELATKSEGVTKKQLETHLWY